MGGTGLTERSGKETERSGKEEPKPATFIYVIRPARQGFEAQPTPHEDAVMDEHFAYLKALLAEGRLVLAGPCLDRSSGVVIFEAASQAEAEATTQADPSVRKGVMKAELRRFHVSLLGR